MLLATLLAAFALAAPAPADVDLGHATVDGWQIFNRTPSRVAAIYGPPIRVKHQVSNAWLRWYRATSGIPFVANYLSGRVFSVGLYDPRLRDTSLGDFVDRIGPGFDAAVDAGYPNEFTKADAECVGCIGQVQSVHGWFVAAERDVLLGPVVALVRPPRGG